MRPLVDATYAGRAGDSIQFDLSFGWQCRVWVLADDLIRVLFLRHGELKEPRTWMVAPGGVDVPWEGRDRLDTSLFPRPDFPVTQGREEITVATSTLTLAITLRPFALRWISDGKTFAS